MPKIMALDGETRQERWRFEFPSTHKLQMVRQQDGLVLVSASTQQGEAYTLTCCGLEPRTGRELWRVASCCTQPLLKQGVVIGQFGTQESGFDYTAVRTQDGKQLYQFSTKPAAWAARHPGTTIEKPWFTDNGTAVVVSRTEKGAYSLFVFDSRTASEREVPLAVKSTRFDHFLVSETTYFHIGEVGNKDEPQGLIQAFDLQTGQQKWQFNHKTAFDLPIGVWPEAFLVKDYKGMTLALDPTTGAIKWQADSKWGSNWDLADVCQVGNQALLFHGLADKLECLDLVTGKQLWATKVEKTGSATAMKVRDEIVYVLTEVTAQKKFAPDSFAHVESNLLTFDLKTGAFIWRYSCDTIRDFELFRNWVLVATGSQVLALPQPQPGAGGFATGSHTS
ncbi:MAG: PQQ-binding-like beta-propeller repeat protein [Blastocatellia bacterium]|nr:PQQ-binding-like beta-propeller repeat protein [Blastocatellia bacterium]